MLSVCWPFKWASLNFSNKVFDIGIGAVLYMVLVCFLNGNLEQLKFEYSQVGCPMTNFFSILFCHHQFPPFSL